MIKGAKSIEALNNADTFVFDKTGTLTAGELEVIEVESFVMNGVKRLLNLTASTEEHYSSVAGNSSKSNKTKRFCSYAP